MMVGIVLEGESNDIDYQYGQCKISVSSKRLLDERLLVLFLHVQILSGISTK